MDLPEVQTTDPRRSPEGTEGWHHRRSIGLVSRRLKPERNQAYLHLCFVIVLSVCRQLESAVCLQRLSHLQIPQCRVCKRSHALCVYAPYRGLWVSHEMFDTWNDILRENCSVRRCDHPHQHKLGSKLSRIPQEHPLPTTHNLEKRTQSGNSCYRSLIVQQLDYVRHHSIQLCLVCQSVTECQEYVQSPNF